MSTAGEQIRKRKEEESVSMAVRIRGQNIDRETNKKTGRKSHEEGGEKKKTTEVTARQQEALKSKHLNSIKCFKSLPEKDVRGRTICLLFDVLCCPHSTSTITRQISLNETPNHVLSLWSEGL